jgi:hypothetical protein
MPVITGWSLGWTSAGVWIAAFALMGILIRQVVPWKKLTTDAEAKLRDMLIERVTRLEQRLDRQQIRHEAEKRLLIHKLRNMTANFDSMLLMLEMNPERGPEIAALIKRQRADQMVAEAKESAMIFAAEFGNEDGEPQPLESSKVNKVQSNAH